MANQRIREYRLLLDGLSENFGTYLTTTLREVPSV